MTGEKQTGEERPLPKIYADTQVPPNEIWIVSGYGPKEGENEHEWAKTHIVRIINLGGGSQ